MRLMIVLISFFVIIMSSYAIAFDNEPQGYWGITWGSSRPISVEWELVIKYTYATNGPYGGRYKYVGQKPLMMPGGVIAQEAYLDAVTQKVYEIRMVAFGKESFEKIKNALFTQHGISSLREREKERHYLRWRGKDINLTLTYNEQTQRVGLSMYAFQIAIQEGVPDDF